MPEAQVITTRWETWNLRLQNPSISGVNDNWSNVYPRRPASEGFPQASAPLQDRRGEVLVVSCGSVESRSSGFG